MAEAEARAEGRQVRKIEDCRALDVGIESFAECLKSGPNFCNFALPFGYAFLCRHPRVHEIVKNTKKQAQAA